MLTDIPDGGESGHLYKFATVLGVFIAIASIYAASMLYATHDLRVRENASVLLGGPDIKPDVQKFWIEYLTRRRDDANLGINVLAGMAFFGLVVAGTGAWFWYVNVQHFEDVRRLLENKRLENELKPAAVSK